MLKFNGNNELHNNRKKTMKIIYDIHKGGNTKYASITKTDRERILKRLQINFYKMLEASTWNAELSSVLNCPENTFRTNSAGETNTLQSFLAGILGQHAVADRDFSVWQLAGITLASQVFDEYYRSGVIEFEKGDPAAPQAHTLYDTLFTK